jgi:hypothetical protein
VAQTAERVVPLPDDPVPQFLTPLSDDGFVDGRLDAIPELTEEAVVAFFGERSMRVLNEDRLADQLMTALGGPPFDRIDLGDGFFVSVACSIDNCGERGAVVMDETGRIVAAGLIGYRCRDDPEPGCDHMPVAYAFIDRDLQHDRAEPILTEWAAMSLKEVDTTKKEYFPGTTPIKRVLRIIRNCS